MFVAKLVVFFSTEVMCLVKNSSAVDFAGFCRFNWLRYADHVIF